MPTITPTLRPGVRAALERGLTRTLDRLRRHHAARLLAVPLARVVGVGPSAQRSA